MIPDQFGELFVPMPNGLSMLNLQAVMYLDPKDETRLTGEVSGRFRYVLDFLMYSTNLFVTLVAKEGGAIARFMHKAYCSVHCTWSQDMGVGSHIWYFLGRQV